MIISLSVFIIVELLRVFIDVVHFYIFFCLILNIWNIELNPKVVGIFLF